jgi:hypothetical protein
VIVTGSRRAAVRWWHVRDALASYFPSAIRLFHGMGGNVDQAAAELAGKTGAERVQEVVGLPALWDLHGRSAGARRNAELLDQAGVAAGPVGVLAFWTGKPKRSPGTLDLITRATAAGCRVVIVPAYEADREPELPGLLDTDEKKP